MSVVILPSDAAAYFPAAEANPALARSEGTVALGFDRIDGGTRAMRRYRSGALQIRLPRPARAEMPEAVLINTAGGLTGGDRLAIDVTWGIGAGAVVTTQAAEKIYRSAGGDVSVSTTLAVGAGATAEWLPQEAIMFDRARLRRSLVADLAADARLLAVEAVVFGRTARGEAVIDGCIDDSLTLRRDGRLVWADRLHLDGGIAAAMRRRAIAAGARAVATILLAAPDSAGQLGGVRDVLGRIAGRGAASAWDGILVARLLEPDGAALRHDMMLLLACLRDGALLPRVWLC
ncbi:MAG: urease accessory protein [Alphaproteobacteria bacterium]|nr:urease accessory protein [Alphaproteobacteria bacterium]